MEIKDILLHFIKICKHKHYVRKYCWKMGLYKQGITHDLSKFSPIEFFESARYYQGDKSPIDLCKKVNGYSKGWQHHKGRNPHHYEYWVDNLDDGGKALIMPKKYAKELIADYLGAGQAYMGKNFSYLKEFNWWQEKRMKPMMMHPVMKAFITAVLSELACLDKNDIEGEKHVFKRIDEIYDYWVKEYKGIITDYKGQ